MQSLLPLAQIFPTRASQYLFYYLPIFLRLCCIRQKDRTELTAKGQSSNSLLMVYGNIGQLQHTCPSSPANRSLDGSLPALWQVARQALYFFPAFGSIHQASLEVEPTLS